MIVLFSVLFILGLLALSILNDDDGMTLLGIIVIMVSLIFICAFVYKEGYKKGQIDAITGTINYEKVIHDNETVTWEEIEK